MKKTVAKKTAQVLKNVLKVEANSASCVWMYELKQPKGIDKFRRN